MGDITHRTVETNGIRMHIAEAGEGPLVLLLHGFPELWYSWRHQLPALAEAGYHAVAPDVRGYGQSEAPEPIEAYTMKQHVADAKLPNTDARHCLLRAPDLIRSRHVG